jgi:hypothetical protein
MNDAFYSGRAGFEREATNFDTSTIHTFLISKIKKRYGLLFLE